MRINRHTRVAAEAVVSAVVLGLLLRWAGLHGVAHTLRGTDLAWFIPAVALSIATVPAMALRWQMLLAAKDVPVGLGWLTRTYFVALFAGQFLPAAIGGDAVRVVELGRLHPRRARGARLGADRPAGRAPVAGGAGRRCGAGERRRARGPGWSRPRPRSARRPPARSVLLFSSRLRGAVARWLEPRAEGRRFAVGQRFYDALHAYRAHRGTLAVVGLLALAVQAARVGVIWMLVRALGLDVPDSVVLLAGPVVFAALALPVSLNGIGVREAVFVYFLHGHTTRPQAIALGLAFFAAGTLTALGGAAVLVVRFIRYGIDSIRPRSEIVDPPTAEQPRQG